jgi:hypothetical protein
VSDRKTLDPAGTPRPQHIFAVFDGMKEMEAAAAELRERGIDPEEYQPRDASKLGAPNPEEPVIGKVGRFVKGLGGESHMAERYAHYLQVGHPVLAVPIKDRDAAEQVARLVTKRGGYEVTYFRDWAIQYMSPDENRARGIATHSHTNVIGEDSDETRSSEP